ncbi:uncharacterized protein [Aristolochia californica]|uniref:uncharacterized protein n=1 Tax=Aristolochia californica TaxID=171875 RepID=UPI0035D58F12
MSNDCKKKSAQVLDGSDIRDLVHNEEVFSSYVDHKFVELDRDHDGKLSVKELQPAVADIGAALGLPAQGTSPDSDHIYSEVLHEFTHGKRGEVSKTEFKAVLLDILLGMAAGLKRDPVVILRIDGQELSEFADSPQFEPEAVAIFSHIASADRTLRDFIITALGQLTVDHGMPPPDSWVTSNVIEPALDSCGVDQYERPISQEMFLEVFYKVLVNISQQLKERPVIVAHSENTFDGSGIGRLLSNKFELDKLLDTAWAGLPKDRSGKATKEFIRLALDAVGPAANLPPYGAVDQMDKVVEEVLIMVEADEGKPVEEEEFKKLMKEVLASVMLQLEGKPISVSANSVVHEPLGSSSILSPTSDASALPETVCD